MPVSHRYLLSSHPPVPGCSVTLKWGNNSKQCWAIIDTGADRTCIPLECVANLSLRQIQDNGDIQVTGPSSIGNTQQGLYVVNLHFLGLSFSNHPVVPINWHEILIGRDIINDYTLTLEGKKRLFSIV
jgi:predicted aspartyl protease